MRRRTALALVLALSAALTLPSATLAGGWSVISLDAVPAPDANEETLVGFKVLQHGRTPIPGLTPIVSLVHPDGTHVTVNAVEEGGTGHYVAHFTLPKAGDWDWSIDAFEGAHPMPPLSVGDSGDAASAAGNTAATAGFALLERARLPLLGIAIMSTVAALGLALSRRHAPARAA